MQILRAEAGGEGLHIAHRIGDRQHHRRAGRGAAAFELPAQRLQPLDAQRLRQQPHQPIELAVAVALQQRLGDPLRRRLGRRFGGLHRGRQGLQHPPKKGTEGAAAVVAAIEDPLRELQQLPVQLQGQGRSLLEHPAGDRGQVALQLGEQRLALGRIEVGAGAIDRPQALAHLLGGLLGAAALRQRQPQPPLRRRVALAQLQQQLRQPRRPQRLEVAGIERGAGGGHGSAGRGGGRTQVARATGGGPLDLPLALRETGPVRVAVAGHAVAAAHPLHVALQGSIVRRKR